MEWELWLYFRSIKSQPKSRFPAHSPTFEHLHFCDRNLWLNKHRGHGPWDRIVTLKPPVFVCKDVQRFFPSWRAEGLGHHRGQSPRHNSRCVYQCSNSQYAAPEAGTAVKDPIVTDIRNSLRRLLIFVLPSGYYRIISHIFRRCTRTFTTLFPGQNILRRSLWLRSTMKTMQ